MQRPAERLYQVESAAVSRLDGRPFLCESHQPHVGGLAVKKNEIKPWQVKSWVIPEASAAFVAQMEEVLDTYEKPYDPAHPVICLDETPQQLIGETRTPFTDSHGVIHADYEYERHGVADI